MNLSQWQLDLGPQTFNPPPMQSDELIAAETNRLPVRFEPDEAWEKCVTLNARETTGD